MEEELNEEYYKAERKTEWRDKLRKEIKAKERTDISRVRMPEADPNVRNKSNLEVNKGLTLEMALGESHRCLDCAVPTCIVGCPVGTNIPKRRLTPKVQLTFFKLCNHQPVEEKVEIGTGQDQGDRTIFAGC